MVLHIDRCMQPQQQTTQLNNPKLAPQMHTYTNIVPMLGQMKTGHPMHNRRPKPDTNTNITLSCTHNPTHRIYILS